MINLHAGKTFLKKTAYRDSAYENDRVDLAAVANTQPKKLTDNFLTMWLARDENWSWFSDADWAAAETNARNFAKTANIGRLKGFFFDPEPYGTNPWVTQAHSIQIRVL